MPDPRAGNQVALTGMFMQTSGMPLSFAEYQTIVYAAACLNATITLPASVTTLELPPDWDGPFGQGLTPATTAITFIAALMVGGGAIAVVNTM